MPLCPACRGLLCRRPFPVGIQALFALVVLILLVSLTQFPASLRAAIAFERGRRAEAAGNYRAAAVQYQVVAERFPGSALALGRLGIAYYRAGSPQQAVSTLRQLEGHEVSGRLAAEINHMVNDMNRRYR